MEIKLFVTLFLVQSYVEVLIKYTIIKSTTE